MSGEMSSHGGLGVLITMSGAISPLNAGHTSTPKGTPKDAGSSNGQSGQATNSPSRTTSAEKKGGGAARRVSAANDAPFTRKISSTGGRKRRESRMGNFGYTGLLGNLSPRELPNLLEQPRSRLTIEESKQLQEATEMGIYMQRSSQNEQTSAVVNARAPAGQLRLGSFARRVALTAFGIWENARSQAKQEHSGRPRTMSVLHIFSNVESERGSSQPSAQPSRRSSRTESKETSEMVFHNSADPLGELAEAESNISSSSTSAGCERVQDNTRRVGALMGQFFQRAMREAREVVHGASGEALASCGMPCEHSEADADDLDETGTDFGLQEGKKAPKNRLANRNSPDQSPRVTWSWGFSEGLRNSRDSVKLLDDQSYVDEEMSKLRKGKVMLKDALATIDSAELFENHCLYTPYAQQIRRKKESMMAKESGDAGSVSLPSLQPRARQSNMSDNLKTTRRNAKGSFYPESSEEKGKKKGSASPTNVATQVRELQLLMHRSTHNVMQPSPGLTKRGRTPIKRSFTTSPKKSAPANQAPSPNQTRPMKRAPTFV